LDQFSNPESLNVLSIHCVIVGFNGEELAALVVRKEKSSQWQLASGKLSPGENAEEAADRIVFEFTGLKGVHRDQVYTFSHVDPARFDLHISISFLALVNYGDCQTGWIGPAETTWVPISRLPDLPQNELEMINKSKLMLRDKINVHPTICYLLESRFTITQLKKLYESIFETRFDKRNFYKRIMTLGTLKRLNEKEKTSSRKGAFYYAVIKKNTNYRDDLSSGKLFNASL
jgi:8-oxo-dGTP diphosphatase